MSQLNRDGKRHISQDAYQLEKELFSDDELRLGQKIVGKTLGLAKKRCAAKGCYIIMAKNNHKPIGDADTLSRRSLISYDTNI